MSELHHLQRQFLHYILGRPSTIEDNVESTSVLSAAGRLSIYATGYKLRLKEAITTDYEKLHTYLGDTQFDQLMDRHIEKYPSAETSLRYYSTHIPQLLQEEFPFNQFPILHEIATIESAFANSFDAADSGWASLDDLAALAPESWATLQLGFQPSVQLLSLNMNSFEIWKALSNDNPPPEAILSPSPTTWVLWRNKGLVSHYRPLAEAEKTMLILVLQGANFSELCEKLLDFFSEIDTPMQAVSFLQSWLQEEMLSTLHTG